MANYDVTYLGGHSMLPKRIGHVTLEIATDTMRLLDRRRNPLVALPLDKDSTVFFPHAMRVPLTWSESTKQLLSQGNRSVVICTNIDGEPNEIVLEVAGTREMSWLYKDIIYALDCSRGQPSAPYYWAPDAHYMGGHPQFPSPSTKSLSIVITPHEIHVWSDRAVMFSISHDAIDSVHTKYSTTSGKFLGFGAEGMLEASVASWLTRRNHHLVVINAWIDQKMVSVVLKFEFEETQLKVYQAVQTLAERKSPEESLPDQSLPSTIAEQLNAVAQLFREHLLDEDEYRQAKKKILFSDAEERSGES